MATSTVIEQAEARVARVRNAMVLRYLGVVVLVLVGVWVLANLIASPTRFFSVFFEGIGNGALYALIALGYTLVYGIIELINFAHGDLFMLGTVFSSYLVVQWFNVTEPGARVVLLELHGALHDGDDLVAERPSSRLRGSPALMVLIRSQPKARWRLSSRMMYSNCSPSPTILFCRLQRQHHGEPGVEEDPFHRSRRSRPDRGRSAGCSPCRW